MLDREEIVGRSRFSRNQIRAFLAVITVALVTGGVLLSALMYSETQRLEENTALTNDIIVGNLRVAGQTQREMLRLAAELSADPIDVERVELLRSLVAQRMTEIALPEQVRSLGGGREVRAAVDSVTNAWDDELEPAVRVVVSDPTQTALASEIVKTINEVEITLNQLVADGEASRKLRVGEAHETAINLSDNARYLFGLLVVVGVGFILFVLLATRYVLRIERTRAESNRELLALVAETRKLSLVASSTDNLVMILDGQGRVEWTNESFERTTGYELDDIVGLSPGPLLFENDTTDPRALEIAREQFAQQAAFDLEFSSERPDGETYRVAFDIQPVFDEFGELTNYIAVGSDVTQRHAAEAQLWSAAMAAEELAREKSNFLASMSHEIRTPLNAVLGLTGMLLETELDDVQREYASIANSSGSVLLGILNNILDFSALESGRVEVERTPMSIADSITAVVNTLTPEASRRMLALDVQIGDDVPEAVLGDSVRLQQILMNVTANAIKFTEIGGVTIEVATMHGEDGTDLLAVSVRDTGIGIPADRIDRLFRPFSQVDSSISRRFGGTGLGLAISQHLAAMLGGTLTIDSIEGVGSTVRLVLPLLACDPAELEPREHVAAPPIRALAHSILVAEDDAINRRVLGHMLTQLGYRADFVVDGEQAVERVVAGEYDLVLMDIQMPVMDGVEATRAIRKRVAEDRQPMIVALTASALVGDRERFIASGMDGYLSKPIQLQDLARALDDLVARSAGRGSGRAPYESMSLDDLVDLVELGTRVGSKESALSLAEVLVPLMLRDVPTTMSQLRRAVARRDGNAIRRALASVDESANAVSATMVQRRVRLIEIATASAEWDGVERALDQLSIDFDDLRAWCDEHLAAGAPAATVAT